MLLSKYYQRQARELVANRIRMKPEDVHVLFAWKARKGGDWKVILFTGSNFLEDMALEWAFYVVVYKADEKRYYLNMYKNPRKTPVVIIRENGEWKTEKKKEAVHGGT